MTKLSERLRNAKAKISVPEKWCHTYLLNEVGQRCAIGALLDIDQVRCCVTLSEKELLEPELRALASVLPASGKPDVDRIINWNDLGTHKDAMDMYDKAIAAAEAAGD